MSQHRKTGLARPRGRPRSADAEQAIVDATLRLLLKDGYAALTMSRVASAAGASKATIYRRWPTKEQLLFTVFARMPSAVPREMGSLTRELIEFYSPERWDRQAPLLRSVLPLLAAACADDPALAATMEAFIEQRRVPLRLIFKRAVRRQELAADADIEMGIDALQGILTLRTLFFDGEAAPTRTRSVIAFVLRGLGASK